MVGNSAGARLRKQESKGRIPDILGDSKIEIPGGRIFFLVQKENMSGEKSTYGHPLCSE